MLKSGKDNREISTPRRSFCVVGVVEINQSLGGTLGKRCFIDWALDIECMVCVGDENNQVFVDGRCQNVEVGSCERLVGANAYNLECALP